MEDGQEFYFIRRVRYKGQPETDNFVRTTAVTVPELLEEFQEFLRGCGFHLSGTILQMVDPGTIQAVDDEETEE